MFNRKKLTSTLTKNSLSLGTALLIAFALVVFSIYEMPFGTETVEQNTIALLVMWLLSLIGGTLLVAFTQLFIAPELENYLVERIVATILSLIVLYMWVLFVVFMTIPDYSLSDFSLFLEISLYYVLIGVPIEIIIYFEGKMWVFKEKNPKKKQNTLCDLNKILPLAQQESPIWALSADDHYVQIQTEKERHMILSSLTDAIKKTDNVEGLRLHRSHWVAKQGVKKVVRKNGRMVCILHNDITIPVSRSGQAKVKEAGWLR